LSVTNHLSYKSGPAAVVRCLSVVVHSFDSVYVRAGGAETMSS